MRAKTKYSTKTASSKRRLVWLITDLYNVTSRLELSGL